MTTEDHRNSGHRGTVGTEDQRNSGNRVPEEQWVQKTRGTLNTEDKWNSGYRGPEEQLVQRQSEYRGPVEQ